MLNTVNRASRALVVAAAALLMAACASSPPKPDVDYKSDYNFGAVKTIAFYAGSGQVSGDNSMQLSDIQIDRVDDALTYALKQKGFNVIEDASQADMLVSWHLVTQFKTDVQTYNSPGMYGPYYGYNRYAMYNCWSCMGGGTEVVTRNYTDGTFILDMIDPQLKKSVWRSTIQSRIKDTEHLRDQDVVNAAAVNILGGFPPGISGDVQ
ncbi:DUF4136 domain-containing protein [Parahaliea aestuarii]|uniref:DUF4136 domain-containing protein n=1 Tax=Parahaliea aestuarii TaxID=1852021 RepID=A0A5C8ZSC1_9GAMM|nr:DUF4136 domain-containing protein [Parahaliea aestuarii]TXS90629.1 DUF4136 domain-containing protein [Parahaliea aestuarii]